MCERCYLRVRRVMIHVHRVKRTCLDLPDMAILKRDGPYGGNAMLPGRLLRVPASRHGDSGRWPVRSVRLGSASSWGPELRGFGR
jgi:hypothetical protein